MHKTNRAGFTLIEILLVVTIVLTLFAFFGQRIWNQFFRAQAKVTKLTMQSLQSSLLQYRTDMGRYPTSREGGLQVLINPPSPRGEWSGPYIEGLEPPKDGWGGEFEYNAPPVKHKNFRHYELISYGRDATAGGTGSDGDIVVGQ